VGHPPGVDVSRWYERTYDEILLQISCQKYFGFISVFSGFVVDKRPILCIMEEY